MIVTDNNLPVVFADNGLTEAVRYIAETRRIWSHADSVRQKASKRWDDHVGYDGALKLAKDGWDNGVSAMLANMASVPVERGTPTKGFDIAGERPDIGRYLAGEPAHMISRGRRSDKAKVVHLVVQANFSASVTAEQMMVYGSTMATIVDILENSGRRVELDVVYFNEMARGVKCLTGWKVKRAEDPMVMTDVAFSLAHAAANRRIGFALYERLPLRTASTYYGFPKPLTPEALEALGCPEAFAIAAIPPTAVGMKDALRQSIVQVNKAAGQELVTWEG